MPTETYSAGRSEDHELVRATVALLGRAQAAEPNYASGHCPINTGDFSRMLERLHCKRVLVPMPTEVAPSIRAGTFPPIGGFQWITLRDDLDVWERTFAERHELAHILNGDADGFVSLADHGYLTWPERKADLFALADIFPTKLFASLRRAGLNWRAITVEIRKSIVMDFGPRWPVERVRDRAKLRVMLYRQHGV